MVLSQVDRLPFRFLEHCGSWSCITRSEEGSRTSWSIAILLMGFKGGGFKETQQLLNQPYYFLKLCDPCTPSILGAPLCDGVVSSLLTGGMNNTHENDATS